MATKFVDATFTDWRPSTSAALSSAALCSPPSLIDAPNASRVQVHVFGQVHVVEQTYVSGQPAVGTLTIDPAAFVDNSLLADNSTGSIAAPNADAANGMPTFSLTSLAVGGYRLQQVTASKAKGDGARGNPPRGRRRV